MSEGGARNFLKENLNERTYTIAVFKQIAYSDYAGIV